MVEGYQGGLPRFFLLQDLRFFSPKPTKFYYFVCNNQTFLFISIVSRGFILSPMEWYFQYLESLIDHHSFGGDYNGGDNGCKDECLPLEDCYIAMKRIDKARCAKKPKKDRILKNIRAMVSFRQTRAKPGAPLQTPPSLNQSVSDPL